MGPKWPFAPQSNPATNPGGFCVSTTPPVSGVFAFCRIAPFSPRKSAGANCRRREQKQSDRGHNPARDVQTHRARPINSLYPYRSAEHTSELQSLMRISYADCYLNKQTIITG